MKKTPAVSLPKMYHDSDMSSMDMEFLPPPPPPFFFLLRGSFGNRWYLSM